MGTLGYWALQSRVNRSQLLLLAVAPDEYRYSLKPWATHGAPTSAVIPATVRTPKVLIHSQIWLWRAPETHGAPTSIFVFEWSKNSLLESRCTFCYTKSRPQDK